MTMINEPHLSMADRPSGALLKRQPDASAGLSEETNRLQESEIAYFYILSVPYVAGLAAFSSPEIGGFRLTGWIFAIMLALAPLMYLLEGAPSRFPVRIWIPWALIVLLSLIWVDGLTLRHFQDALQIITPFVIAPIASKTINSAARLEQVYRSFAHCLLILIAALALHYIFDIEILVRPMSITAAIVGCVFVARYHDNPPIALMGWSGCVLVAGMTGSRMATLALLMIWLVLPTYRRPLARLAVLGLIVTIGLILFYSPVFQERFFGEDRGTLADIASGDFSSAGRFDAWPGLVAEIRQRPLLGAGVHESAEIVGQVWENVGKPHNDYLRILLEQGLVGLVLFLTGAATQVISLWRRGFPRGGKQGVVSAAAFAGMFVLLLMAVTDNPIVYGVWFMHPLFILLGAAYSMPSSIRSDMSPRRRKC
jgi:O-antigen ligase